MVLVLFATSDRSHRSASWATRWVTSTVTTSPATIRVAAKGSGRSTSARAIVVMFNIGAPRMNESRNVVDAPRRTSDGAMTDEQHEQNGWGSANSAPNSDP